MKLGYFGSDADVTCSLAPATSVPRVVPPIASSDWLNSHNTSKR